jgi:hypothetical protein
VARVAGEGRGRAGEQAWDQAYRRGRAMDRTEAIARLDPDRPDRVSGRGGGAEPAVVVGQARRR